jgi:hypothetical protein
MEFVGSDLMRAPITNGCVQASAAAALFSGHTSCVAQCLSVGFHLQDAIGRLTLSFLEWQDH